MNEAAGSPQPGRTLASRRRSRAPAGLALAVVGVVLAGCSGSGSVAEMTVPAGLPGTLPLGELPDPLTEGAVPVATYDGTDTLGVTTTTSTTIPRVDGPIGQVAAGNRLLVIGDSLFASAAPRNDGIACDVLTGFGWDVEIDAEPGRFVDFADAVLDARFDPDAGLDWDVVAIFLGNQFDGDTDAFEAELDAVLERLAPRPVVLYTLAGGSGAGGRLNAFIRSRPDAHPNIVVIDWAQHVADETDRELLDGAGPGLTDEGSGRIVVLLAGALNRAPDGVADESSDGESDDESVDETPVGECLEPAFADDSAIVL